MATVYSYLRFSRPEQLKGDSQRRQLDNTRKWVEAEQHTLDKSLDLRDLGVSAFRGRNSQKYGEGQLGLFLECVETGRVKPGSILAVESLDRITRQELDDAHQLIRQILKAGVSIKTFTPNDFLSPEDVNNPFKTMMVLMILTRAHEESKTKSERLKSVWKEKRKGLDKQKITSRVPHWLKVENRPDGTIESFQQIPERVEIVRRIFELSRNGVGLHSIVRILNKEKLPPWGRAKVWRASTVRKFLRGRAVLGEYQPHVMQDGQRVPTGEPVRGYFPQVIGEELFYAVQQAMDDRRSTGGRNGEKVTNLFQGMIRDARDGSVMHSVHKGERGSGPQLVSSAARVGVLGSLYVSFPYEPFEKSLFVWAWDLKIGDVIPRKATNLEAELAKTEGELADIKNRIQSVQKRLKREKTVEALLDLLLSLEEDRITTENKLERLRAEMASTETEALDRTKDLIQKIQVADPGQLFNLRIKLRATIRRMVEDIVLLVVEVNSERVGIADVKLKNGNRRKITIYSGKPITLPDGLGSLDVREWSQWPEKFKQRQFKIMRDDVRQMIELEERGFSRSEIARKLGVSKTHVSRWLIRHGRRKHTT